MKLIYNNLIPFKGFKAINLFGLCFVRNGMKMSEKDINHPVAGEYIKKYFAGTATTSVTNRFKIMRLIENLTLGTAAVGYLTESLHGAGSPQAQRVMISRQSNMPGKKALAKAIVHIED